MAKKQNSKSDASSRARAIAQKAKPNMRVVAVIPQKESTLATPDAIAPDIQNAQQKYGFKAVVAPKPGKELHMVVMEPKQSADARTSPKKITVVVDDKKVVGEQG